MKIFLKEIHLNEASKIQKWKTDNDLSRMILSKPCDISLEEAKEWINKNSKDSNQVLRGIYQISGDNEDEKGILIGIIRLMYINYYNQIGEVGLYIGDKNFHGMGIGKISIKLMENIAFNSLNLNKIFARIVDYNLASVSTFSSLGYMCEGSLRDEIFDKKLGKFSNVYIYSKFKEN